MHTDSSDLNTPPVEKRFQIYENTDRKAPPTLFSKRTENLIYKRILHKPTDPKTQNHIDLKRKPVVSEGGKSNIKEIENIQKRNRRILTQQTRKNKNKALFG